MGLNINDSEKTGTPGAHVPPPRSNIHACADPEIFMRGGPTKMVIFCHRRGGVQPPKNPKITFF